MQQLQLSKLIIKKKQVYYTLNYTLNFVQFRNFPGGAENITGNLVKIDGIQIEILNENVSNLKQACQPLIHDVR
jgi:hypothetical protein